jgi:spore coat polysaccharide biosynthesis protein SpsF (cytidylyltransferase family)/spore coat polysaccharide biosynthesis predicted glycosyltransferase SpsG
MITAIILLRSGSSRLPLKHLYKIGNENIINIITKKLSNISNVKDIVLATGIKKDNSIYKKFIKPNKKKIRIYYHRNNDDVTERINEAIKSIKNEFILLISGDCIVLDKEFIDYKYSILKRNPNKDFLHFNSRIGYEGINLFRKNAWSKVQKLSLIKKYKEHPGLVVKEKKNFFNIKKINSPKKFYLQKRIRLSIDTFSDYQFFKLLFLKLKSYKNITLKNIKKFDYISNINKHVVQRMVNKTYDSKLFFITTASNKYGLGHLRRTENLIRDFSETYTNNIELIILDCPDREKIKKILKQPNLTVRFNTKKILNENLIIDLPETILVKNSELIRNNKKVALIDNYKISSKKIINIIPSFFKIKKVKMKNLFSGKKFLSINRDINFYNLQNTKIKLQTLILSGGALFPPKEIFEIVKNNKNHKFILVLGPFFRNLKKKYNNHENLEIIIDPKNYFELIKESQNVICRFGVSIYEILALGKTPYVWKFGEKEERLEEIEELSKKGIINLTSDYPNKKNMKTRLVNVGSIKIINTIILFFNKP